MAPSQRETTDAIRTKAFDASSAAKKVGRFADQANTKAEHLKAVQAYTTAAKLHNQAIQALTAEGRGTQVPRAHHMALERDCLSMAAWHRSLAARLT